MRNSLLLLKYSPVGDRAGEMATAKQACRTLHPRAARNRLRFGIGLRAVVIRANLEAQELRIIVVALQSAVYPKAHTVAGPDGIAEVARINGGQISRS